MEDGVATGNGVRRVPGSGVSFPSRVGRVPRATGSQ